jgi:flavin reductase (DIM6/NTAB) family NADH-FMN oxidoreductase RutF
MSTATDEQLAYRSAISRFAGRVTVVTATGPDGHAGYVVLAGPRTTP